MCADPLPPEQDSSPLTSRPQDGAHEGAHDDHPRLNQRPISDRNGWAQWSGEGPPGDPELRSGGPWSPGAGPPWARRGPGPRWREWEHRRWRGPHERRSRWLFLRFAGIFGLLALIVLGGLALLIFFVVRLAGGDQQTAALLWFGTCGLLLMLPLLAGWLGRRAFRNIAAPLADLLDASTRVAAGDLGVRVPVPGHGEFAQLSRSFNHMVEELALADRRRRNLTADVAHELRTPLQIIQGNLEGLLDGVYSPSPAHIEATLAETRVLARLVEDLRVLSQAEAGQLPMHWETIDVRELLADVGTSFSGQAQAAGLVLSVESPAGGDGGSPLFVRGDYGRLEQVLGNLLTNALRHTASGGAILLSAEPSVAGIRLLVADTGEGIAAEELPFVFDRFWRGDRARTHGAGAGSGLGLAIARQLVQAHGGTIAVQSTPGAGTTFTIDLPLQGVA